MQDANGPDLAPARHQFSDADQRPGDVVNSYEATPRSRGRDNLGRLAVGEDRRAVPVQPNNAPSGQRCLGRAHPGPELPSPFRQLAPGHGVPEIEGADPTPDETPDRNLRQNAAAHVVGVRRQSEADRREVLLALVDEIGCELRRLPDEDRQHAGRVGIERARVPDATHAQTATNDRDNIERGRAAPLVDDEDAGAGEVRAHDTRFPSTARRTAASTTRVASGSGPVTVQPAALTCPPPPNCAAIFWTSTSPLPRRLTFTSPSRSRKRQATRTEATERG